MCFRALEQTFVEKPSQINIYKY